MSYEFTKLSNVPAVSEFPEGANAIIETNGEIKRCPSAGGSSVPKPLTYDYMPEGYPKKTAQTTTLLAEQELAFALGGGRYVANLTNALDIVEGQTYTVKWDGTEYECVCVVVEKRLALGNLSIMGVGTDTGEPFMYMTAPSKVSKFATLDTSASHTISVKTVEEVVTPMVEEFLPAGVGTTALITYDLSTNTYSSDLAYDELHKILLDHREVVLWEPEENRCSYLTRWKKLSSGRIDLAFAGQDYSVSLKTDGTIVKKPIE